MRTINQLKRTLAQLCDVSLGRWREATGKDKDRCNNTSLPPYNSLIFGIQSGTAAPKCMIMDAREPRATDKSNCSFRVYPGYLSICQKEFFNKRLSTGSMDPQFLHISIRLDLTNQSDDQNWIGRKIGGVVRLSVRLTN